MNLRRPILGLPYVAGLLGPLGQIYKSHSLYLYREPANTFHSVVMPLKDRTQKEHLCGTIYHIICDNNSSHMYIGETKRPLIELNDYLTFLAVETIVTWFTTTIVATSQVHAEAVVVAGSTGTFIKIWKQCSKSHQ